MTPFNWRSRSCRERRPETIKTGRAGYQPALPILGGGVLATTQQMKIFVAGGTGALGRALIAELLAKGHALVALTRYADKPQALVEQGIEPAIADVFDTDAVKAVLSRAQPEVAIEQLTALPRTYTRQSLSAAAAFNNRIRLEGG